MSASGVTPEVTQADMMHAVMTRESVRSAAEILKALGVPPMFVANEMLTRAILLAAPFFDEVQARNLTSKFFADFFAGLRTEMEKLGAGSVAEPAPFASASNVIPLVKPANDVLG